MGGQRGQPQGCGTQQSEDIERRLPVGQIDDAARDRAATGRVTGPPAARTAASRAAPSGADGYPRRASHRPRVARPDRPGSASTATTRPRAKSTGIVSNQPGVGPYCRVARREPQPGEPERPEPDGPSRGWKAASGTRRRDQVVDRPETGRDRHEAGQHGGCEAHLECGGNPVETGNRRHRRSRKAPPERPDEVPPGHRKVVGRLAGRAGDGHGGQQQAERQRGLARTRAPRRSGRLPATGGDGEDAHQDADLARGRTPAPMSRPSSGAPPMRGSTCQAAATAASSSQPSNNPVAIGSRRP